MRAILNMNHADPSIRALSRYAAMRWDMADQTEMVTDINQLVQHERYEQWTVESLLAGHLAVASGDSVVALRCSWQAREYQARCSPNLTLSDAWLALRSKLEDLMR